MRTHPSSFLQLLADQRAAYAESLPQRLALVESLWTQLQFQVGADERSSLSLLQHASHTLAGSSATFGFAAVGEVARTLENAVTVLLSAAADPRVAARAREAAGLAVASLRLALHDIGKSAPALHP